MPKVVSYSDGSCEPIGPGAYLNVALEYTLTEHLLMDMAANGISFDAAAGDTGSSCDQANPNISGTVIEADEGPSGEPFLTSAAARLSRRLRLLRSNDDEAQREVSHAGIIGRQKLACWNNEIALSICSPRQLGTARAPVAQMRRPSAGDRSATFR